MKTFLLLEERTVVVVDMLMIVVMVHSQMVVVRKMMVHTSMVGHCKEEVQVGTMAVDLIGKMVVDRNLIPMEERYKMVEGVHSRMVVHNLRERTLVAAHILKVRTSMARTYWVRMSRVSILVVVARTAVAYNLVGMQLVLVHKLLPAYILVCILVWMDMNTSGLEHNLA